jgi:hypothetical protein
MIAYAEQHQRPGCTVDVILFMPDTERDTGFEVLVAGLRCCPVCGRAVSGRKIYDSARCKQKAYRSRK